MALILTTPGQPTQILAKPWLGTLWNAEQQLYDNPGFGLVLNWTEEVLSPHSGRADARPGLCDRQPIAPGDA